MSMLTAYCLNGYLDNGTSQFVDDFPDFFHATLFWGCGGEGEGRGRKGGKEGREGRKEGKEGRKEGKEGRKVLI